MVNYFFKHHCNTHTWHRWIRKLFKGGTNGTSSAQTKGIAGPKMTICVHSKGDVWLQHLQDLVMAKK